MEGWIKLHRKFIDWEWYDDINTKIFFLHILLIANHKSIKWRGIIIPRGGTIRTLETLANETGLSKQNIRTAIKKLKSTQELTQEKIEKHWVITINNYDLYQSSTQELTQHQHDTNTQSTLNKNDNNEKNEKKKISFGKFVKLTQEEYDRLKSDFGKRIIESKIEDVNNHCGSKGVKYKDYNLTIRAWLKRANIKKKEIINVDTDTKFWDTFK